LEMGDKRRALAAEEYKRMYAPFLHIWSLLSANSYTIVIFLITWFLSPLYYFIVEITLFNVLLAVLLVIKNRMDKRFLAFLGTLKKTTKT